MNKTISIYSTMDSNGKEGKRRCIYEEVLNGFEHIYTFDYLIGFFEKKAREYFNISLADDEKFYDHRRKFPNDDDFYQDTFCIESYYATLQIVWVVKTLKVLYDRGYVFEILEISSERQGWIMNFTFDFSNLTKEQIQIIELNAFEQNQFSPDRIVI